VKEVLDLSIPDVNDNLLAELQQEEAKQDEARSSKSDV
jgi:hypothetical protein